MSKNYEDLCKLNQLHNKAKVQLWQDFGRYYAKNKKLFGDSYYRSSATMMKGYKWRFRELPKWSSFSNHRPYWVDVRFQYGTYYQISDARNLAYAIFTFYRNNVIAEVAVHKDNWEVIPNLLKNISQKTLLTEVMIDLNVISEPINYNVITLPEYKDGWVKYRGINVRLANHDHTNCYHQNYVQVWYSGTPILIVEKNDQNQPIWNGNYLK